MKENERLFKHCFMLSLDESSRSEFYLSVRLVYCVIDNYRVPKFHIFIGLYVNLHTFEDTAIFLVQSL